MDAGRNDEERPHLLVVEDDTILLASLCTFVRREGYSVQGVTNGASALAEVSVRRPDIIVLDLAMPVMDGYEFMERLTSQLGRGRPKVVVLSGSDRLDLAQARLGADAYIAKPFDPDRMRAALHRLAVPSRRRHV